MSKSGELIHPNWDLPMVRVTDGISIEITAKDVDALKHVAPSSCSAGVWIPLQLWPLRVTRDLNATHCRLIMGSGTRRNWPLPGASPAPQA